MTIFFDMDGTLAGLFFVKGFSAMLAEGNMTPYIEAKPLFNTEEMASVISALIAKGYEIGIISYADEANLTAATTAKKAWLAKFFPFASEKNVHICTKSTAKTAFMTAGDILVDDAKANREAWEAMGGTTVNAYFRAPIKMIDALKTMI